MRPYNHNLSRSIHRPKWTASEVLFTLFRLPDMSDEKYAEDMKTVARDLRALKDLLEK